MGVPHFGCESCFARWGSVTFTMVAVEVPSALFNGFNQNGSHPNDINVLGAEYTLPEHEVMKMQEIRDIIETMLSENKVEDAFIFLKTNKEIVEKNDYYMLMGDIYFDLNDFHNSKTCYDKLFHSLDENNEYSIFLRYSSLLKEMGEYQKALYLLEILKNKHPHDDAVIFNIGNIFLRCGNIISAIEMYEFLYKEGDRSPDLIKNLSIARNRYNELSEDTN
jgi:tetratricopeptide (TPR) repeat protein